MNLSKTVMTSPISIRRNGCIRAKAIEFGANVCGSLN